MDFWRSLSLNDPNLPFAENVAKLATKCRLGQGEAG
jgi:hypothetical protein